MPNLEIAEEIYQDFCEAGVVAHPFQKTWNDYQDSVGWITSGSPAEKLVIAAMQYALEQQNSYKDVNELKALGTPQEEDWDKPENLTPLNLKSAPHWNEYDQYLLDGGQLEYEEWIQARRDYKFNLTHNDRDRCASCTYRNASKECKLLEIAIADPYKSACPLYEFDGVPF